MTQELVHPGTTDTLIAGRYRVGPLLGRGGMASVYRAEDELLGRPVAIKFFTGGEVAVGSGERERREMRVLASLNHPALVTVYDASIDAQPSAYLIMELVDGPALDVQLRSGPLSAPTAALMAVDLGDALATAHGAGIVHRDIKPSNVLLSTSSVGLRAKLADFGIATIVDSARLTATGSVSGTAAYLAPEQLRGAEPAPPADIYSLGLVILESLTAQRAFPGTTAESLSRRLAEDPSIPQAVPAALRPLVAAAVARNPADRPSAAEVRDIAEKARRDLERVDIDPLATMPVEHVVEFPHTLTLTTTPTRDTVPLSERADTTRETTTEHSPRRRFVLWSVIGAAALVAGVVVAVLIPNVAPDAKRPALPELSEPLDSHMDSLLEAVTP